jgi:hypothetical protein
MTESVASGWHMPSVGLPTIDWNQLDLVNLLLWNVIVHGAVLAFLVFAAKQARNIMQALYVSGTANEWVLIMNNGVLKQTGIGLACFKGPYD